MKPAIRDNWVSCLLLWNLNVSLPLSTPTFKAEVLCLQFECQILHSCSSLPGIHNLRSCSLVISIASIKSLKWIRIGLLLLQWVRDFGTRNKLPLSHARIGISFSHCYKTRKAQENAEEKGTLMRCVILIPTFGTQFQ